MSLSTRRRSLRYGNAVVSASMQTVVETPSCLADADRLFSPTERAAIVDPFGLGSDMRWLFPAAAVFARSDLASVRGENVAGRASFICLAERTCPYLCWRLSPKTREPICRRLNATRYASWLRKWWRVTGGEDDKGRIRQSQSWSRRAKAYLDGSGNKRSYGIHVPARVNVKKIRARLGLSQERFAQTYGFALSAVRDWEQGRRQPERSARILLRVVEREPEAVTRALAKTA